MALNRASSVLDEIVAAKRVALAQRKRSRPLEQLQHGLEPSSRSLLQAIRQRPCRLILECKRKAPSAGVLCPGEYQPKEIALQYRDVASAISVLTDEPYFGGSLSHLRQVSAVVPLPVLCKDFVVDPYQIYEARSYGADAILLMASVLDPAELERCLKLTRRLKMDALVEVRDEAELAGALSAGAELVGINNRNLRTLEVSLHTTEQLAPQVPDSVTLITESGIRNHGDLRRLRPLVDGFLVGSSLMCHQHPGRAARQLAYGRVKVCGLTRVQDVAAAHRLGASWAGLIFARESKRVVSEERARQLMAGRELQLRYAGVFVNEPPERVARLATALGLDAVQLHGEETAQQVRELAQKLPDGCQIWNVCQVGDRIPDLDRAIGARVLLDSGTGTQYPFDQRGGTGRVFDWELVRALGAEQRQRLILAGGIDPKNAAAADSLDVWALDVNSGVELLPGVKSVEKMQRLFANLRGRGRTAARKNNSEE